MSTLMKRSTLRPTRILGRPSSPFSHEYESVFGRRCVRTAGQLPKVMYRLIEPDHHRNKRILVVGGGDSAVEAAMALAQ